MEPRSSSQPSSISPDRSRLASPASGQAVSSAHTSDGTTTSSERRDGSSASGTTTSKTSDSAAVTTSTSSSLERESKDNTGNLPTASATSQAFESKASISPSRILLSDARPENFKTDDSIGHSGAQKSLHLQTHKASSPTGPGVKRRTEVRETSASPSPPQRGYSDAALASTSRNNSSVFGGVMEGISTVTSTASLKRSALGSPRVPGPKTTPDHPAAEVSEGVVGTTAMSSKRKSLPDTNGLEHNGAALAATISADNAPGRSLNHSPVKAVSFRAAHVDPVSEPASPSTKRRNQMPEKVLTTLGNASMSVSAAGSFAGAPSFSQVVASSSFEYNETFNLTDREDRTPGDGLGPLLDWREVHAAKRSAIEARRKELSKASDSVTSNVLQTSASNFRLNNLRNGAGDSHSPPPRHSLVAAAAHGNDVSAVLQRPSPSSSSANSGGSVSVKGMHASIASSVIVMQQPPDEARKVRMLFESIEASRRTDIAVEAAERLQKKLYAFKKRHAQIKSVEVEGRNRSRDGSRDRIPVGRYNPSSPSPDKREATINSYRPHGHQPVRSTSRDSRHAPTSSGAGSERASRAPSQPLLENAAKVVAKAMASSENSSFVSHTSYKPTFGGGDNGSTADIGNGSPSDGGYYARRSSSFASASVGGGSPSASSFAGLGPLPVRMEAVLTAAASNSNLGVPSNSSLGANPLLVPYSNPLPSKITFAVPSAVDTLPFSNSRSVGDFVAGRTDTALLERRKTINEVAASNKLPGGSSTATVGGKPPLSVLLPHAQSALSDATAQLTARSNSNDRAGTMSGSRSPNWASLEPSGIFNKTALPRVENNMTAEWARGKHQEETMNNSHARVEKKDITFDTGVDSGFGGEDETMLFISRQHSRELLKHSLPTTSLQAPQAAHNSFDRSEDKSLAALHQSQQPSMPRVRPPMSPSSLPLQQVKAGAPPAAAAKGPSTLIVTTLVAPHSSAPHASVSLPPSRIEGDDFDKLVKRVDSSNAQTTATHGSLKVSNSGKENPNDLDVLSAIRDGDKPITKGNGNNSEKKHSVLSPPPRGPSSTATELKFKSSEKSKRVDDRKKSSKRRSSSSSTSGSETSEEIKHSVVKSKRKQTKRQRKGRKASRQSSSSKRSSSSQPSSESAVSYHSSDSDSASSATSANSSASTLIGEVQSRLVNMLQQRAIANNENESPLNLNVKELMGLAKRHGIDAALTLIERTVLTTSSGRGNAPKPAQAAVNGLVNSLDPKRSASRTGGVPILAPPHQALTSDPYSQQFSTRPTNRIELPEREHRIPLRSVRFGFGLVQLFEPVQVSNGDEMDDGAGKFSKDAVPAHHFYAPYIQVTTIERNTASYKAGIAVGDVLVAAHVVYHSANFTVNEHFSLKTLKGFSQLLHFLNCLPYGLVEEFSEQHLTDNISVVPVSFDVKRQLPIPAAHHTRRLAVDQAPSALQLKVRADGRSIVTVAEGADGDLASTTFDYSFSLCHPFGCDFVDPIGVIDPQRYQQELDEDKLMFDRAIIMSSTSVPKIEVAPSYHQRNDLLHSLYSSTKGINNQEHYYHSSYLQQPQQPNEEIVIDGEEWDESEEIANLGLNRDSTILRSNLRPNLDSTMMSPLRNAPKPLAHHVTVSLSPPTPQSAHAKVSTVHHLNRVNYVSPSRSAKKAAKPSNFDLNDSDASPKSASSRSPSQSNPMKAAQGGEGGQDDLSFVRRQLLTDESFDVADPEGDTLPPPPKPKTRKPAAAKKIVQEDPVEPTPKKVVDCNPYHNPTYVPSKLASKPLHLLSPGKNKAAFGSSSSRPTQGHGEGPQKDNNSDDPTITKVSYANSPRPWRIDGVPPKAKKVKDGRLKIPKPVIGHYYTAAASQGTSKEADTIGSSQTRITAVLGQRATATGPPIVKLYSQADSGAARAASYGRSEEGRGVLMAPAASDPPTPESEQYHFEENVSRVSAASDESNLTTASQRRTRAALWKPF